MGTNVNWETDGDTIKVTVSDAKASFTLPMTVKEAQGAIGWLQRMIDHIEGRKVASAQTNAAQEGKDALAQEIYHWVRQPANWDDPEHERYIRGLIRNRIEREYERDGMWRLGEKEQPTEKRDAAATALELALVEIYLMALPLTFSVRVPVAEAGGQINDRIIEALGEERIKAIVDQISPDDLKKLTGLK